MGRVLPSAFFERPAETVARELLGCYLVRRVNGGTVRLRIVETEAYVGPHDRACHAAKGRTARTEVMFGSPGRFYIYLVYGMHWMLNVVTGPEGYPAAVLIRGVDGIEGPARVTRRLAVTRVLNGERAVRSTGMWFEACDAPVGARDIVRTARIGVEYAGAVWARRKLRFVLRR